MIAKIMEFHCRGMVDILRVLPTYGLRFYRFNIRQRRQGMSVSTAWENRSVDITKPRIDNRMKEAQFKQKGPSSPAKLQMH